MNLKAHSIRVGPISAVFIMIKKSEDIQQEDIVTVETLILSNIDVLKQKQELKRKLDDDIIQGLNDENIETEIRRDR